jgi:predicted TIM-barrel fold metal-dependent hydrolase
MSTTYSTEGDIHNQCLPPPASQPPKRIELPAHSWDCHVHVLGPFSQFPLQSERGYTPPESTSESLLVHLRTLGFVHGVVVQPSVYGTDNLLTAHVVQTNLPCMRGVAVLRADVSENEIAHLHTGGIRGFRVNALFPGGMDMRSLERTAAMVSDYGWHVQLLIDIRNLPELSARLGKLPIPAVFDHMGHFPFEMGVAWAGFELLLKHLHAGKTYVKLSGSYRMSSSRSHISDVASIAKTLIAEAPERMVWGSDWPHVGLRSGMPVAADLLDGLCVWCPDSATRQKILSINPLDIYF